jgi:hypothetical protein
MSLTTIQAFNKIAMKLRNIKTDLTVLTGLTVEQNLIFEEMKTVYMELATYTFWTPLKKRGTIALVTADNDYAFPTDFFIEDPESFKYNNDDAIPLGSQQMIDRAENDRTQTGEPSFYYKKSGNFVFDVIPDSKANGKSITYDYFYIPTQLSTATPTATLWLPTPFDDTVFCNWVIQNMFEDRESNRALVQAKRLEGNNKLLGSLDRMLNAYEDQIVNEQISHTDDMPNNLEIPTRDYGWRTA